MTFDSLRSSVLVLAGLLAAAVALVPASAQAQISPDRPGIGDGASVVMPGTFQAELGYQYTRTARNFARLGREIDLTTNQHELGQLLLRYGLADFLELRAGIGSYASRNTSVDVSGSTGMVAVEGDDASGYLGTSFGAKARLINTPTATVSAISSTTIPTETGGFETPDDRARQTLKLAGNGALGTSLSLSVNAGASFFWSGGEQEDRLVQWLFIPTLNIPINEKVGTYVGYAGFYNEGENSNFVETGLTFLATPDTQLDVNGGLRIDSNIDSQFFLGLGLAQRF